MYVFLLLMKKIRIEGGIKLLDTLWSVVQKEILENSEWESEAEDLHFDKDKWFRASDQLQN